jgi:O-antigen/teichoic acid export membrane protein
MPTGARILSIGIASTGLFTFIYFSIASHVLGEVPAKRVDLLWSVMFVIISVIYRPIEQLLSRTIADRRARGIEGHPLRVPVTIQASFALVFAIIAISLHSTLQNHAFDHSSTLYWILVIGTLAYAASYFARGWLAGHQYFALYGGLVFMEATSRLAFAVAAAVAITHGQSAVALGIAAGPFASLIVVPLAFASRGGPRRARVPPPAHPTVADADAALEGPATEAVEEVVGDLSMRRGAGFAFSVSAIMLSEQALLNLAVITVDLTSKDHALPGIVFNVLLIARSPLQLFQAIQTSMLPHLAGLEVSKGHEAFARAIRVTVLAIAAFAAATALGLLAIGPPVLGHVFGQHYSYNRFGLALVGIGMGLHLTSGALNQAALARDRARASAACWLAAAAAFIVWMFLPVIGDQLLRTEVGYLGATALLATLLFGLYRRGRPATPALA